MCNNNNIQLIIFGCQPANDSKMYMTSFTEMKVFSDIKLCNINTNNCNGTGN